MAGFAARINKIHITCRQSFSAFFIFAEDVRPTRRRLSGPSALMHEPHSLNYADVRHQRFFSLFLSGENRHKETVATVRRFEQ